MKKIKRKRIHSYKRYKLGGKDVSKVLHELHLINSKDRGQSKINFVHKDGYLNLHFSRMETHIELQARIDKAIAERKAKEEEREKAKERRKKLTIRRRQEIIRAKQAFKKAEEERAKRVLEQEIKEFKRLNKKFKMLAAADTKKSKA